mmetsp:Transcript_40960/g.94283  ORF Transcript_40960/g.94283 Transcript_40960/m.94283 type:complete len:248 (+) Transcript_40960:1695-2438(+)
MGYCGTHMPFLPLPMPLKPPTGAEAVPPASPRESDPPRLSSEALLSSGLASSPDSDPAAPKVLLRLWPLPLPPMLSLRWSSASLPLPSSRVPAPAAKAAVDLLGCAADFRRSPVSMHNGGNACPVLSSLRAEHKEISEPAEPDPSALPMFHSSLPPEATPGALAEASSGCAPLSLPLLPDGGCCQECTMGIVRSPRRDFSPSSSSISCHIALPIGMRSKLRPLSTASIGGTSSSALCGWCCSSSVKL